MTNRPDYIKCIQHTSAYHKSTSWCGKSISSFDWVFQDIDHAIYAIMSEARQVPCPECVEAIREVFKDV
jgi:hypothetical protein